MRATTPAGPRPCLDWKSRAAPLLRGRSACSDRSCRPPSPTPTSPASCATAATRSRRSRCGPTCSRRSPTPTRPGPPLVVAGDDRQARDLAADLRAWLTPRAGPLLPEPRRRLRVPPRAAAAPRRPADRRARRPARPGARRARAAGRRRLRRRAVGEGPRPDAPPARLRRSSAASSSTSRRPRGDLVAAGYERVEQVDDRGQFAVRGGLLDLYPATEDRAVRVDLCGDEIESLRWFSTFTQRSLGDAERVEIAPAAELAEEHRELAEIAALEDEAERPDIAELLPVERLPRAARPRPRRGARSSSPPSEDVPAALRDHWEDVMRRLPRHRRPPPLRARPTTSRRALDARARIRPVGDRPGPAVPVPRPDRRRRRALAQGRRARAREAHALGLPHGRHVPPARAGRAGRLQPRAPAGRLDRTAPRPRPASSPSPRPACATASSPPGLKLAVIPEHRLLPPPARGRARAAGGRERRRGVLRSFADLRTGDIVVHEDHGLARFAGFDTKTVAGVTRDYLELEFAGTDKVFLPVDQLAKISRYVGAGGAHPPLSKLGGTRWETIKARARRAAQELAGELLNLLRRAPPPRRATRSRPTATGSATSRTPSRTRETPDQREAIEVVKADMEAPRPMDRLICGDVGYGKTEVALRAAFKAAADGRQVLMLVPDDDPRPAALRHVRRAAARLPVHDRARLALPPRGRAARGDQALLRGQGRHPHRHPPPALARRAREGARPARSSTRSSASGSSRRSCCASSSSRSTSSRCRRDADPAHAADVAGRRARHLGDRDAARGPAARQDLRRRVRRGARQAGDRARARPRRPGLLPPQPRRDDRRDGRAAARPAARRRASRSPTGRWTRSSSRSGCCDFLRGDADVLVCTTIIESGIDIPQANTLIVDRADHFGLAQLYQIRGRVGPLPRARLRVPALPERTPR